MIKRDSLPSTPLLPLLFFFFFKFVEGKSPCVGSFDPRSFI